MTNWYQLTRSYCVWDDKNIKGFFGKDEYGFLSNFYPAPTMFEGIIYPTSEHGYMAAKTEVRGERDLILACQTAKEAKELGRKVTLRANWENGLRDKFMLAIVFDKFWRNPKLAYSLLQTGNKYLEESNHWRDLHFGVDYKTGEGQNMLGKILMGVRESLKSIYGTNF